MAYDCRGKVIVGGGSQRTRRIGLAVSEAIVRRLGGRILCRSSPGRGTIFGVLLPRRPAHTEAGKPTGASS